MKKLSRSRLMDKMHRGFVWGSIGLSAYTCFCIGDILYDYFTRVKPQLLAKQDAAQAELLQEGVAVTANLLLTDKPTELN